MGFRLAPFAVVSLLVLLGASAAFAGDPPAITCPPGTKCPSAKCTAYHQCVKKEAEEPAVQIDYSEKAAEAIPVGGVGRLEEVPDQLRAPTGDNIYGYQNVERAGVQRPQRYNRLPKVANVLGIKEATGGQAPTGAGPMEAGVHIVAAAVASPAGLSGGAPPAVGVPIDGRVGPVKAAAAPATPAERASQLARESRQLLAMRSWKEAADKAVEALGSDNNNAAAQIVLSNARRKLGDCRGAETHARSAVALEPINAQARKALARALSCQGRHRDALPESEHAARFAPKDANAWALHASVQDAAGRRFEARRALQQAADLDPRYGRILALSADGKTPIRDPDIDEDIAEQDRLETRRGGGSAIGILLGAFGAAGAGLGALAWRRHRRWQAAMQPALPPEPARPPGLADKYEVVRVLAQAAGGDYLEARDRRLGRTVAIRRVPVNGDPSQRADVVGRAKTTASLRHPGLLDVYEVFEERDFVYVVFEWIRGKTAGQKLAEAGRMGLEEAIEALDPVCEAVAFSHSQGVSRGRVGPECIVFTDLGVSKLADLDAKAGADEVAKEADVRALGACLYQLVTGARPPGADVAPSGGADGVPPALDALVAEALAPAAQGSPMSAAQFLQRLRALRPAPAPADAPGGAG